jgi:HlyD family secretion protein
MPQLPATATPQPHLPAGPESTVVNGSPRPSRLPRPKRWSVRAKLLATMGAFLVLVGIATGGWIISKGKGGTRPDLLLHTVKYEDLKVMIVERGALESADNADVVCRVKAKVQGGVASTIRSLVEAGSEVKAGDKLIELDDSAQEDQLRNQKIVMDTDEADWINAEKAYDITISQNVSDIAKAELDLDIARITLHNYVSGDYEVAKRTLVGQLQQANSDLEMWRERSGWSTRMSRPGRRYVTQAQAESDAARLESAKIAFENLKLQLSVLDDPKFGTKVARVKFLQGDVDEKERVLDRTKKQANAKEVQAEATRRSKKSIFEQAMANYRDIEDEIRKCTMYAPHGGLVVYVVPESTRNGVGSSQTLIAQGESVKEGQKLMRIPDLTKMVVNTRVHEAMVSRARGDQWQKTGFSDSVQAALWISPDFWTRLSGESLFALDRGNFVERYKSVEQLLIRRGQQASIRVDSFPGKILRGHVKTVATVASQQDFLSADVKVYQTMVSIDEPMEGLRPDMSAEVTITTDNLRNHVLTIPLQAVVATPDMGSTRKCFVKTPEGPVEREITLGLSNDKMVEVVSGLQEGDEVVNNPRLLLSDKDKAAAGIYGKSGGQPDGASPEMGKEGGPGGGEGKKGRPGGKDGKKGGGGWKKGGTPAMPGGD